MQYAPTLRDQKFDSPLKTPTPNDSFFVYRCRGVLHTPHKYQWQWANESSNRYVLGRMPYAPTLTDQKFDSHLSIESKTRYAWGCKPSRSIHSRRETLKICMNTPKTRRGFDEYGHIHAKPAEDSMNMAIFTQNPPRIGRIWPFSRKTRRGFDEYGHICAKPAEDGTNMAISTQNPSRIG